MDFSPIIISMKTAAVTILITFVLGLLAARGVFYRKKEASKILWDGIFTMPLVLPPTVAGFFLLYILALTARWEVFSGCFRNKNRFFLGSHGACRSSDIISSYVPVGQRRSGTDRSGSDFCGQDTGNE